MLTTVAIATLSLVAQPKFLDTTICGVNLLVNKTSVAVFDSKKSMYFVRYRHFEPEGSHYLYLGRTKIGIPPHLAWDKGTIPNPKTGKGIRLGDSGAKVERILGKPTSSAKDGQLVTWTYKCNVKGPDARWTYFGVYRFVRSSLESITFTILGW